MAARILDGKSLAAQVRAAVKREVEALAQRGIRPGLAVVLVGENPASRVYVRNKVRACEETGVRSELYELPANVSEDALVDRVLALNDDPDIHGILVQLPLPKHIDERTVMMHISPEKDVDGFNPLNMGKMFLGREGFVPCTPKGIVAALEEYKIDVAGKNVVVVGHSNVVGKPAAIMLLNRNATVKVCHVFTKELASHTKEADILIVATGVKGLIKADMVKEGAIVFDVGITWIDDRVYGDVDFDSVLPKVRLISPVPGGVGPMTIAILMQHTLEAARSSIGQGVNRPE